MSLLNVNQLSVALINQPEKKLVDNVSFKVNSCSMTALVGGSGSGKTTIAMAIMQLLSPALILSEGKIIFDDREILTLSNEKMRQLRGAEMSMIFQEPLYAFNPVFTIADQLDEVLQEHSSYEKSKRIRCIEESLDLAGISDIQRVMNSYPHQLSGGMRQRAMIAQAVLLHPRLIIADEPTSSLDVVLQAKVMQLFEKLKKELDIGFLFITHDLGLVKHFADQVVVLSQAKVVEQGSAERIMNAPKEEFTQKLMEAMPSL